MLSCTLFYMCNLVQVLIAFFNVLGEKIVHTFCTKSLMLMISNILVWCQDLLLKKWITYVQNKSSLHGQHGY
jgi:hypothetical protein